MFKGHGSLVAQCDLTLCNDGAGNDHASCYFTRKASHCCVKFIVSKIFLRNVFRELSTDCLLVKCGKLVVNR